MLLFLQLVLGFLQLLLDLLDVLVHLPDGGVQNLPNVVPGQGLRGSQYSIISPSSTSNTLVSLGWRPPPGELVRHVLREEPVGHGGAVRYLRPDHFVHQD